MSFRYFAFYKPYDVVSQFSDREETGRPTLKDFIPIPGVYPVGRLDRDSEGLLLLTDDGVLQHRLIDPRYEHPRTYWVQVEGVPGNAALDSLRKGVQIQNYRTKPATASLLPGEPDVPPRDPPIRVRKAIPTAWIELTIKEGRNRQVRRMTAAVGFPTLRLIRVRIGGLGLFGLHPGKCRELTSAEVESLRVRPPRAPGTG